MAFSSFSGPLRSGTVRQGTVASGMNAGTPILAVTAATGNPTAGSMVVTVEYMQRAQDGSTQPV